MSSLAWIDFDEAERQRAQRIMAFFQERESRDELGLGAIRDSISDHLFPGTSTIQTRLRYMLFIPWLFQLLEGSDATESQVRTKARDLETGLADALKAGGESKGIIGREAGRDLLRLPSSVYWAGLGSWGIRLFPGSIESLLVSHHILGRSRASLGNEDGSASLALSIWTKALPPSPKDLLKRAVFRLTVDEAQFIVDRLIANHPNSLLTMLARDHIYDECGHIWEHPRLSLFPPQIRRLLNHADIFSQVMHGASLLYNLSLSELRKNADWSADYREQIQNWKSALNLSDIRNWSLDDFWDTVAHPAHTIRPGAKQFVKQWVQLVNTQTETFEPTSSAGTIVEGRERHLKTTQSRYINRAARDNWRGASGVDRLAFRWNQAKSYLLDLANVE